MRLLIIDQIKVILGRDLSHWIIEFLNYMLSCYLVEYEQCSHIFFQNQILSFLIWAIKGSQFSSVQSLSRVRLFATPWTAARQASLSITNSRSSPKPMSIESMMPSNHLTLCRPLLLLPSIFPSIRVFSNESALCIQVPL